MYDITFDEKSYKVGLTGSPSGAGIFYRHTVPLENGLRRILDYNFTGIRNIREKSVLNQRMVNATPYVYGKVNRLYAFRPQIGIQKLFSEKINKNSILF